MGWQYYLTEDLVSFKATHQQKLHKKDISFQVNWIIMKVVWKILS